MAAVLLGHGFARAEPPESLATTTTIAAAPGATVPPSATTPTEAPPATRAPAAAPGSSSSERQSEGARSRAASPSLRFDRDEASAGRGIVATPVDYAHDGFYVRFGLGFGGMTDTLFMAENREEPDAGVVNAFGSVGEVALGVAVSDRLVLGGGIWATTAYATSFTQLEGSAVPERLRQPRTFAIAGGFGDWYLSDTNGFHAQAGLGLAVLTGVRWEQRQYENEAPALGPGVMLGFGHEWWVDKQWAVGALARLTAAAAFEEVNDQLWTHAVGTFPSLLLTATYN